MSVQYSSAEQEAHAIAIAEQAAVRAGIPSRARPAESLEKYQSRPQAYAKEILGVTLTPDQDAMLQSILENRYTLAQASHAIGKCVAASEFIPLADGSRRRAGDLIGRRFRLLTLVNGIPKAVNAHAVINAIEPVYALTTESGRRVIRNAEHPFMSANATFVAGKHPEIKPLRWTSLSNIRPGDVVAVASTLSGFELSGETPLSDSDLKLLAYLIGDGGYTARGVSFTQQDNQQLTEFKSLCAERGAALKRCGEDRYQYRVVGTRVRASKSRSPSGVTSHRLNEVADLLRRHGLMGKHSRDKRVPPQVFVQSLDKIRLFLSRLYATDGWASASNTGAIEIGFCSVSENLVRDVQELLLRFGIAGRLRYRPEVHAWDVSLHSADSVLRFCDQVGIFGKTAAIAKVRFIAEKKLSGRSRRVWRTRYAPSGTILEKVKSIEYAGIETTVAVEVPEHHTFLTTFWEHNTFTAAVATSWWYDCWDKHIGYITAPTWPQALGLTFKQLKTLRRAKGLPGIILDTGIIRDLDKLKEGEHYIRALNAERGEGFQGEHSAPILIVIEEGVGVPKYIWDAVGGLMTHPDNRVFAIGNPTDEATEFGLASESILYNTLSISALEHPNIASELRCEKPPFPDAVRLLWLSEMLEKECELTEKLVEDAFEFVSLAEIKNALEGRPADLSKTQFYMPTAYFQGRVLGEFPTQADQQVIPRSWLKSQPRSEPIESDMPELGSDVARFGDDRTTIFVRRGPCLISGREIRKMDGMEVAQACMEDALAAVRQWKGRQWTAITDTEEQIKVAKKVPIKIDTTGGPGMGPYFVLKTAGYNAIGVNSTEPANDREQYKNVRSELWFDIRKRAQEKRLDYSRLRQDIRLKLEREWSTPKYKSPGYKIVEEKEKMKKRLGYSPDLADGANLAFYQKPIGKDRYSEEDSESYTSQSY